jgi:hypothetical protein
MGMFDDITVPKSYLRNLLSKKEEKLLAGSHSFQTKSLDNLMDEYKIHRKYLYKLDRSGAHLLDPPSKGGKWIKVNKDVVVNFYDTVKDGEGNEYLFEFDFTFVKGWLDRKKLITCKLHTTAERRIAIDKMWDTEQEILDEYRDSSVSYRFFRWVEGRLQGMTNWARKRHSIPLEVRKEAYEKSGRLKEDPRALDLYMDQ